MASLLFSAPLVAARRYVQLLRRYRAPPPLSFTRRKTAFYAAYWAHAARRLGADVEDLGGGLLQISRGDRSARVRYHYVDLDSYFNKALVDDKAFVAGLVRRLGFVAPRYARYRLDRLDAAAEFLARTGTRCVVKPESESGGRGITTQIDTPGRLIQASLAASASFSLPSLMLEEQQPGDSYRLLYLDGALLHAVKRGRPTVVGDGTSSIRALVRQENARRLEDPLLQSLCELTIDLELEYALADQGLSLRTVPRRGEQVVVKNVSNQNSRREQSAVTAKVHADYQALAAKVYEALGAHLIGIDVMSQDISAPPARAGGAILEINIPPGLHYHELVAGESDFSDAGSAILDRLLRPPLARRKHALDEPRMTRTAEMLIRLSS